MSYARSKSKEHIIPHYTMEKSKSKPKIIRYPESDTKRMKT